MATPNPNIIHFLNVKLDKGNYLLCLSSLSVVVDVAETGSTVVIVDVPSHHHISPLLADLNARSAIILAIMLINTTIVMMIRLAQLCFSTLMGIVQSIPTGMLIPEPLIT